MLSQVRGFRGAIWGGKGFGILWAFRMEFEGVCARRSKLVYVCVCLYVLASKLWSSSISHTAHLHGGVAEQSVEDDKQAGVPEHQKHLLPTPRSSSSHCFYIIVSL